MIIFELKVFKKEKPRTQKAILLATSFLINLTVLQSYSHKIQYLKTVPLDRIPLR